MITQYSTISRLPVLQIYYRIASTSVAVCPCCEHRHTHRHTHTHVYKCAQVLRDIAGPRTTRNASISPKHDCFKLASAPHTHTQTHIRTCWTKGRRRSRMHEFVLPVRIKYMPGKCTEHAHTLALGNQFSVREKVTCADAARVLACIISSCRAKSFTCSRVLELDCMQNTFRIKVLHFCTDTHTHTRSHSSTLRCA